MKILVTGANGFIGRNLCIQLENEGYEIFKYDQENTDSDLSLFINQADFIFHLAGINRPKKTDEFYEGNSDLTLKMINFIEQAGKKIPIVLSSSIQAALENDYGKSKFLAEEHIYEYGIRNEVSCYIFRLANVFGKWSRPNYNTVIATFCYKISRDEKIEIHEPNKEISFVYIDDVINAFITCLKLPVHDEKYLSAFPIYNKSLQEVSDLLYFYKDSRSSYRIPRMDDEFSKKLYSTYLSFLDKDDFSYSSTNHVDQRGSFSELFKGETFGQVSINISKPGIVKGNHWHHTKIEKVVVVKGTALIRFRELNGEEIIEYQVNGEELRVVDIPPGYTHSIVNVGKDDLITVIWANEMFDADKPDTYYLEVEK